jgi:hypothetical protein
MSHLKIILPQKVFAANETIEIHHRGHRSEKVKTGIKILILLRTQRGG